MLSDRLASREHPPEALVLLTLFPPKAAPGERRGGNTYYLATTGQILHREPSLIAVITSDLGCRPGYSLGLIVNEPRPVPDDWGTLPEHFAPYRRGRDGQPLTREQQLADQEQRCQAFITGQPGAKGPRQWGASNEHISPCRWLFAECDSEGMSLDDQLALAVRVFGAEPAFTISTTNKSLHCYFGLREPISTERFTVLQKLVIAAYRHLEPECSIDSSLAKPAQVMRLAGGLHPKTGQLANIHTCSGSRFDADALEVRLRGLLPPSPPSAPPAPAALFSRPRRSFGRHRPRTLQDVVDHLATLPRRVGGQGTYVGGGSIYGDRNVLWGLVKACEEAGYSIDTAIALMEAHSPSTTCGWDVAQVACSGGDHASAAWFWGAGR